MTPERKNELFDKMLEWIYEHIKDEEELFRTVAAAEVFGCKEMRL